MNGAASRWIVSVHFFALVVQFATAMAFAAGWPEPIAAHSANGWVVVATGMAQAIWLATRGAARASVSTRVFAVGILVCEIGQLYFGLTPGVAIHVSLAMLIWAGGIALLIRVWAPRAVAADAPGKSP